MRAAGLKVGLALVFGVGLVQSGLPAANGQVAAIPRNHIYPTIEAAQADIDAGVAQARKEHKRVILDFGGDWCGDCQVLNIYFHQSPNAELMTKYYVLVDVNIGRMDANLELAHKYGVPITGVPALAVLDGHGKVVYAQTKEFSDMRHMESSALTEFLNKWKP